MQPAAAPHGLTSTLHAAVTNSDGIPSLLQQDSNVAVSVRGVSKYFRGGPSSPKTFKERLLDGLTSNTQYFRALDEVSFDINQGETFGIIGHNGSGKSTLLKIIAGIMRPTQGEVLVRGRLAALLELGAGFHPELTGAENIYLNGAILGLSEDYVTAAFGDIVEFAEIEDFVHSPVKHYSSGMRARLGFSVATHLEPDVLLIDEVLSVGDERFRQKCMERVHAFRSMGRTMVLVSHSASMIAQLCERSVVLSRGRLLFAGDSTDAISAYRNALATERRMPSVEPDPTEEPSESRAVSIIGARLVDQDTETTIAPHSDVAVRVDLEAFAAIDCRLRITVRSEDGTVLINQASTPLLGRTLQLQPGPYSLKFTLHDVPLRDGKYLVDLTVESADGRVGVHRLGGAITFEVASSNPHLGLVAAAISCEFLDQVNSSSAPTRENAAR